MLLVSTFAASVFLTPFSRPGATMHSLLKMSYSLATWFIEHPERAYFVALIAGTLWAWLTLSRGPFRTWTRNLLLLTTMLWVAFGMFEQQFVGAKANIRVDLLFTWPFLLLVSMWTTVLVIRDFLRRKSIVEKTGAGKQS